MQTSAVNLIKINITGYHHCRVCFCRIVITLSYSWSEKGFWRNTAALCAHSVHPIRRALFCSAQTRRQPCRTRRKQPETPGWRLKMKSFSGKCWRETLSWRPWRRSSRASRNRSTNAKEEEVLPSFNVVLLVLNFLDCMLMLIFSLATLS